MIGALKVLHSKGVAISMAVRGEFLDESLSEWVYAGPKLHALAFAAR